MVVTRRPPVFRSITLCALVLCAWSCATSTKAPALLAEHDGSSIELFAPENVIGDAWRHLQFSGKSTYKITVIGGRIAIRATADNSASGLIRRIDVDPKRCYRILWSWRVDQVQKSADIRMRNREDVAASLYLLFGDPGFLSAPVSVPTLRYVWTNDRVRRESVIDSPYMKGSVRSLVVRNELRLQGQWITEHRDLRDDYRRAFGAAPNAPISAVAIFTDNDQTSEPVTAFYGPAKIICDR